MPKTLGEHPELKKEIKAGLGRFGPFVVCDGDYRSIPKGESIFQISLQRALELFAQPKKGRGKAAPLKELGAHPTVGDAVNVMNGPYGPYIKCGKTNVSLPEGTTPEEMTLAKAVELLADKIKPAKAAKKAKAEKAPKAGAPKKTKSAAKTPPPPFPEVVKAKSPGAPAKTTVIRRGGDKRA